jgi:ABC-type lipoprotein release transport system permease subunit
MTLIKHRNLLEYALGCLIKYKVRTVVVFTVFTIAVTLLSSVLFLQNGLEREAEISVDLSPDITVSYLKGGRILLLPESFIDDFASIEGAMEVKPRIWGYVGIGTAIYTAIGFDLSETNITPSIAGAIGEGRFLTKEDSGTQNAVVGPLLAKQLGLEVGDYMILISESIESNKYTVVGIFSGESSIYTSDLIVMPIDAARELFKIPEGYVTDAAIYVDPEIPVDNVAAELSNVPNLRTLTQDTLDRGYKMAYASRGGFITTIWIILLAAVALICFSQATIVGRESRFEVGLLKTAGFTTLDVIEIRLIESVVLGVTATSLGIIIGTIYDVYFKAGAFANAMLGWAFLPLEFTVPIYISFASVAAIFAVTVFPLIFATIVPAWLNAITDPDTAMRRAAA